ncbi:hypothetical protein [Sideroxydans sp. CL21]|uniref:WD40/YVTN/BNR-like repeat-containing protein n=1 Tax=Sideroxydans sp. CL21 TaxID=2600596 RepID=UPI0024BD2F0B|nr:hypothetical protein [Sideroxydans sp. CL21]
MKRFFAFIMVAIVTMSLAGCFGSGASSAPQPTNVAVAAKDSRVVVTWDSIPGVTYWVFTAAGTGVTPTNCSSMAVCGTTLYATSPQTVSSLPGTYGTFGTVPLTNGVQYSFTVNGRINGGPGGPGSPAIEATPRLAGNIWNTGPSAGTTDLRGVAYGAGWFVAAGLGGSSFYSLDGNIWTALSNTSQTDFYAVNFNGAVFLGIGANGNVMSLSPGQTSWTQQYSGTNNTLYAITSNGAGMVIAAGVGGTIITTNNSGGTWGAPVFPTGSTLYGLAYGLVRNLTPTYVAVGAAGTLLYSTDGVTWYRTPSPLPTIDLKGVTYGGLDSNGYGVFVAVGNSGTVLTSEDGINWTQQTSTTIPNASNLNSVTYTTYRRFMAVGADGNIYYSEYYSNLNSLVGNGGAVWTQVTPPVATSSINAITTGGLYDYSAVGAGGLNLYAD